MKEVVTTLQSDILHAAGIWVLLVFTGLFALLLFKSKVYEPEPTTTRMPRTQPDPARSRRHAEHTQELIRFAQEITVAAGRAATMAARRREEWLAAQAQLDEAWEAYETSDADARRLSLAAALPTPEAPKTPSEYAYRERFLHRAAMAACSRKQLSALDLSDALAHREGWDPKRHPADQEVVLRRAIRDCMWSSYRSAAKRERAAWRSADMANEAKTSLRQEARLATARASQAAAGKPLGLVGDIMIRPRFKPDRRRTADDTMALPQFKPARRSPADDTMVLPQFKPDRRRLASDTMVLPTLG